MIESIISVAILAMIVMIVTGGLQVALKGWARGEDRIEEGQTMRSVLNFIALEIGSSYRYILVDSETKARNTLFWGEHDQINFISAAPGLGPDWRGLGFREVSFFVNNGGDSDAEGLVMREATPIHGFPFDPSRGQIIELCRDVVKIEFEYLYMKKVKEARELGGIVDETFEPIWIEKWGHDITSTKEMDLDIKEIDYGIDLGDDKEKSDFRSIVNRELPWAVRITVTIQNELANGDLVDEIYPTVHIPLFMGRYVVPKRVDIEGSL